MLKKFTFPPTVYEIAHFHTPLPRWVFAFFEYFANLIRKVVILLLSF